ncbi:MAG: hypothetical protein ACRDEB_07445 [Chitinophagaceae bacterium]
MMNINHIKFPASVISELYQFSLLSREEIIVNQSITGINEIQSAIKTKSSSLGDNKRNVLIIVNYPDNIHLPDDHRDFLTEILKACNMGLADVAILNVNNISKASYHELVAFYNSKVVLLFAVEPDAFGLPLSFPHFQIQPFAGVSYLFSPSLMELKKDNVLKSKLWICLKRMFNL